MQDIRLEQIQTELHRMKKMQVKNSKGPVFIPQIGDIVLFQPTNKHNMQKFGRVTELFKHNLTREGDSITKPISDSNLASNTPISVTRTENRRIRI